jgi:hypothetical protein
VAVTAAAPLDATRTLLLAELEEILGCFANLGEPAQDAVVAVATSLIGDCDTTEAEQHAAAALVVLRLAGRFA